jgi:hypothetical protein
MRRGHALRACTWHRLMGVRLSRGNSNNRSLPTPDQPVFRVDHLTRPLKSAATQYPARRILDRQCVGDDGRNMLRSAHGQSACHGGSDAAALAMRERVAGDLDLAKMIWLGFEGAQTDRPNLLFNPLRGPKRTPAFSARGFGHLTEDSCNVRGKLLSWRVQNAERKPRGPGRQIIGVRRDEYD